MKSQKNNKKFLNVLGDNRGFYCKLHVDGKILLKHYCAAEL